MRPLLALHQNRDAVVRAAGRFKRANPRMFGSAMRGNDKHDSNRDLIVNALLSTTLFDLSRLRDELQKLVDGPVDVVTSRDLPTKFRQLVLSEARPV